MTIRNNRLTTSAGVTTFAALLAFGAGVASTAAYAQAQAPSQTQAPADATLPATTSTTANIDEAKLDKFVSAYSEVLQLQKEANEKQTTSADASASQALATETQTKMTTAVQRSGLEIDEFNQIAQQMLKDEDLRSRIAAKMQVRGVSGG
jgi:transcription initiation factor IIF auxiliary subunit